MEDTNENEQQGDFDLFNKKKLEKFAEDLQDSKERIDELTEDLKEAMDENEALCEKTASKNMLAVVFIVLCIILAVTMAYFYFGAGLTPTLKANTDKLSAQNEEYKGQLQNLTLDNDDLRSKIAELESQNPFSPSGIVYRVQIGAFQKFKMSVYSQDLMGMGDADVPPFMKYSVGLFRTYNEALSMQSGLRRLGFRDAFIVAQSDGIQIPVENARQLQGGEQTQTQQSAQ